MFGDRPEKFLPGAQIDLIRFHSVEAESSDDFTEKTFTSPIQKQVRDDLKAGRAIARRYRNRRIGEFLKEIDLSEKRSTGITKILRNLSVNGSPPPEFETNDERDYLIVTVCRHKSFETTGAASSGCAFCDSNGG